MTRQVLVFFKRIGRVFCPAVGLSILFGLVACEGISYENMISFETYMVFAILLFSIGYAFFRTGKKIK